MTGTVSDFDDLHGLADRRMTTLHDDLRDLYLTDVPAATEQTHLQRIDAATRSLGAPTPRAAAHRRLLAGTGIAAVVFVSGAGLAAAGVLPPPVQHRIAALGVTFGLHLPSGEDDPAPPPGAAPTEGGGTTSDLTPPTTMPGATPGDDARPDADAPDAPGPDDTTVDPPAPEVGPTPSTDPPATRPDTPYPSTPPTPVPSTGPPISTTPSSAPRPSESTPAVTRPSVTKPTPPTNPKVPTTPSKRAEQGDEDRVGDTSSS